MGGKSGESNSFFDSRDDDGDDDEALKQLRKHLAILALWVAAIRSAPYFISMWENRYNYYSLILERLNLDMQLKT